ncbi:MAG: hypothetical protein IGNPGNKH_00033 [Sodalis sp. Ffu]|nr:MAG: hypothetical protein IGNPGNKH_00033 [Sodalis sp. Ffu]
MDTGVLYIQFLQQMYLKLTKLPTKSEIIVLCNHHRLLTKNHTDENINTVSLIQQNNP